MNQRIVSRLVLRVIVLVGAVVLATRGGYDLLWLLLLPLLCWDVFRLFRPAATSRAAGRFTEPGDYRVVLQVPGANAIALLRQIRVSTGLGLLEAKQLIDSAPVVVVENLSEESAELVADRLRGAGARALAAPIEKM